MSIGSALDLRQ